MILKLKVKLLKTRGVCPN